jgi:hypothetical protein
MGQLAMVGVRLICVLFMSQAAVLVGTKLVHTVDDSDPLAPYAAIMPGQPVENLAHFSCNWQIEDFEGSGIGVCQQYLDEAPFSFVSISIRNATIQDTTFRVDGLYAGDLARHWGRPTTEFSGGEFFYARWYRGAYTITARLGDGRRFSYRLPVRYIYVTGNEAGSS